MLLPRLYVIFLVISLCLAKLHYFWCDFFSDDVGYISFDCTFNVSNSLQFVFKEGISMLSNLHEFRQKTVDVLCSRPESCSMVNAIDVNSGVLDGMSSLDNVNVDSIIAMNMFLRQQIVNNIVYNGFDIEDSSYLDFSWTKVPTFGLVINCQLNEFDGMKQMDTLIQSIVRGTADITKWAKVSLAVGFVIGSEETSDVDVQRFWALGESVCSQFYGALAGIKITCIGYAPKRIVQLNAAMQSRVQLREVHPHATLKWDLRESLCRDTLSTDSIDYFVLLDDHIIFRHSSWVLMALAGFLNHNTLMTDFGVGYLNIDDHMVPVVPVLPRSYFSVLQKPVFDVSFPMQLNNMLLVDVFSPLSSVFVYDQLTAVMPGYPLTLDGFVSSISDSMLDDYVNKVQSMRRLLIRQVNARYYPKAPIAWTMADLAYKEGDLVFQQYCHRNPGCVSSSLVSTESSVTGAVRQVDRVEAFQLPLYASPTESPARIAYITAIFGKYEITLKTFARQNTRSDFICFTDDRNSVVNSNGGWIVDDHPYHLELLQYDVEHNLSHEINSLHNNQHPFNIAKYYKMNFHRIPRMAQYDVIVWLDGTIEVYNANTSALVMDLIDDSKKAVVAFVRDKQSLLSVEVNRSIEHPNYIKPFWNHHSQPIQNISAQYDEYVHKLGFTDSPEYWRGVSGRTDYGLWVTCFVAFDMRRPETKDFLTLWSDHNRRYTTQDQVSFPFVVQKMRVFPHSLPPLPSEGYFADAVKGTFLTNTLFYKHAHGQ